LMEVSSQPHALGDLPRRKHQEAEWAP